ncbi:ComEC family competence protein [Patescibacteria group bacterium]|nr:ComEC family competence protein [Patescibacteria group bacterium]MBU1247029.1 ComEC family competence protein [Patescibacteria group bacterium]MBU1519570.1 ComEC family competence protein [Patescibacteria group bacterium]MBU1730281.1 ComEC family competence protein [Patescibacteria group bacterium]MBU1956663.1 ComEC family competence protein [Patescibacteria group bacterium]
MKNFTLYCFVVSFAFGIVFRFFIDIGILFPFFLIVIVVLLSFLAWQKSGVFLSQLLLFIFAIFAFSFGVIRLDFAERATHLAQPLHSFLNTTISLEGVIVHEPDERENSVKIVIALDKLFLNNESADIQTKILATTDFYPRWNYGDRIALTGILHAPKNFSSNQTAVGGKEFNYIKYLAKDGIHYQIFKPKINLIRHNDGNWIKSKLFLWKKQFLENISRVLHEPYSALLGGLTVGAKQSLGKELLDDFRATGLIHIVVLSGYNVTIIVIILMRLFSFLPKRVMAIVGIISVGLFVMMTGAGATIVRAGIMAILIIIGRALGREINILRLLFIAGFLMILHNPYIVMFDPSFQLSFLAMLGLVLLSPFFEARLKFIPKSFGFREIVAATIATQIFVFPFLLYMIGEVSIVALIVNLLVLVFIPATMLLGFFTGMLGFASTTLSLIVALPTFILLYYEITIVKLFARFPFATLSVPQFSFCLMLSVYILYGVILYYLYKRSIMQKSRMNTLIITNNKKHQIKI